MYAVKDFKEDQLVLKDQMLVGNQHSFNKVFASFFMFLCSRFKSFCFVILFSTLLCRLIVLSVASAFVLLVP